MAAETKRLTKPEEARRSRIEEEVTGSYKRPWVAIPGKFGGGVYYVDRSSPTDIVVEAKVFLQPDTDGTPKDVEEIKKMEGAIEKSASTKGYIVDIAFVASPGDKRGNHSLGQRRQPPDIPTRLSWFRKEMNQTG